MSDNKTVMFINIEHRWEVFLGEVYLPSIKGTCWPMAGMTEYPELRHSVPLKSAKEVRPNSEVASFAKDVKNQDNLSWASSGANDGELYVHLNNFQGPVKTRRCSNN
jgi:hypothetical protein